MNRIFNKAVPAINRARVDLGLEPVSTMFGQMLRADTALVLTSPVFDFTSPHMPRNVRYAGAQLDDPDWSDAWTSPWPAGDPRPLVLVGLSSTFQDQVATLRRVVGALAQLPVRGLVTLGGTVSPDEVPGRDNVVVVRSAPHAQILPHVSLLVTHCGHGTTLKGLTAGVPLVCLPMGRDQDDTAARVVHRGAGVRLKPTASEDAMRSAIEHVLATKFYLDGARRLADALRAGTGCVDPFQELESLARGRAAEAHA